MPPDHSPTDWRTEPTRLPLPIASLAPLAPVCSASSPEEGPCPVCPHLAERFEPVRRAAYWEAMHKKAVARERLLQQENQELQARIRYLQQQLYGKKSESSSRQPSAQTSPSPRPKG